MLWFILMHYLNLCLLKEKISGRIIYMARHSNHSGFVLDFNLITLYKTFPAETFCIVPVIQ